jgi:hypothetical protein
MKKEFETVSVTFELKVPVSTWIDYLTKSFDIFQTNYCGYWLRGIDKDESGWLCWEDDEKCYFGDEPFRAEALTAWKNKSKLPEKYFMLDKALAIRAYIEGVKKWGMDWMDSPNTDSTTYDVVIQLAMFGEVRYG